jgi:hypothetical protein
VEESGQQALADADKVLVLLSEGVLQGQQLDFLIQALAQDAAMHIDRLQTVCRTELEGWVFGSANPEVAAAPAEVQSALDAHEAVTYRAPSQRGSKHEFPTMIDHLLGLLVPASGAGGGAAPPAAGASAPVATVRTVRQKLEDTRQVGVVWDV